jgi:hypothetical protein
MSGATTAMYLMAGAAAVGTAATIDGAKAAQHQGKLQAEQQKKQLAEAGIMQQKELEQTATLQSQAMAAQRSAQAASLAQASKAASESKALMDKQLKAADENINRATAKRPNTARIVDEAAQAGKAGASGTMLTGSQGVDPSALTLGRSTLLGA